MKKLLIVVSSFFLTGCSVPFIVGRKAGIKIISTPAATVVIDGKQAGQTPLEKADLKAKTYKLQLIPQSGQPWETTLTLHENLMAVTERIFGPTDQESEGYIMELEKIADKSQSQLSVVTIPDPATVRVNGQPKGFAPITTMVADGSHEITISSAGYNEKKIMLSIPKGHRLLLTVQLSKSRLVQPEETATESAAPDEAATLTPTLKGKLTPTPTKKPSPTPTKKPAVIERPYVEILETPTGWLRVRSEPNTSTGKEITKLNPGETYKFIEANDTGWYKIVLADDQEGWISGKYAKLYR